MRRQRIALLALLLGIVLYPAFSLESVSLNIIGVVRNAEIYIPSNTNSELHPVVFAFHGHGGSVKSAAARFHIEKYWPEAIVVYPQGLNTPSNLVDPEGKFSGWQSTIDDQGGRDIEFFDKLVKYLNDNYLIDNTRVYSIGFSNGAVFTYVLWAARSNVLAAVAPIAGLLPAKEERDKLEPKPAFLVAGRKDPLVKFSWQKEMINNVLEVNKCGKGKVINGALAEYDSTIDAPVKTYINNSGHEIPEEALPYIIEFFKANTLHERK